MKGIYNMSVLHMAMRESRRNNVKGVRLTIVKL